MTTLIEFDLSTLNKATSDATDQNFSSLSDYLTALVHGYDNPLEAQKQLVEFAGIDMDSILSDLDQIAYDQHPSMYSAFGSGKFSFRTLYRVRHKIGWGANPNWLELSPNARGSMIEAFKNHVITDDTPFVLIPTHRSRDLYSLVAELTEYDDDDWSPLHE